MGEALLGQDLSHAMRMRLQSEEPQTKNLSIVIIEHLHGLWMLEHRERRCESVHHL
jgi:hypothetical protein